jgi:hypothetical protein
MKTLSKMPRTAVALVAALAATTCGLLAAEPFGRGQPAPWTQLQPGRLSLEQLGKMLADLGFNPRLSLESDGKSVRYDLEFPSGDWTMRPWVSISTDQTNIWFGANLAEVGASEAVPPAALLGLLEQNVDLWPAYVYYYKDHQRLRLNKPVKNQDVTPAKLRQEMETFTDAVKQLILRCEKASKAGPQTPPLAAPFRAPLP